MTYTLPTPAHYVAAHTAGYTGFRDMIVEAAKHYLDTHPEPHSTKELSEALWPTRFAVGQEIDVRRRLVDALLKAAERELKAYAHRGAAAGRTFGHIKRPWLWSKPVKKGAPDPAIDERCVPASLQELCDWIGATAPGAFIALRDREAIAREIFSRAYVTLK